jgi:hypothetical protein
MTYILARDLREGQTYRVEMTDCCVGGEFTSELVTMKYDEDDTEHEFPDLIFKNGVTLTTFNQVTFEIPDEYSDGN